ncbi:Na/Pi cotransporter family protein [Stappia taiwanensis]|uniref:Na/Pi cotransporter family protein n=1 Tax=Stappia taiwanensis TaxID=992267 RepID=A0A838XQJ4_9HYPH|nr:Na/Pi cotransporter family protein [Stappia taiwanensis]MBA4612512.1 Na/Pi cotransporter family protein [Stappia taiwanensis]GGF05933.1 Na+/cotransporter [Stappia taiwanensis]
MTVSLMLLHLAGAVTLLLFAVRMVRTGVERAHGAGLRRAIGRARTGAVKAAASGTIAAVVLQSSTAVAVLGAGFAASGLLGLPVGLSLMLGADLGSALVVRILAYDISWLMPICLVVGGALFLNGRSREQRQSGRILVGIALILLSLRLMGEATAPLREGAFFALVVDYLSGDFLTAFLLGALFTWAVHSSVGAILLFMTLAAQNVLPADLGIALALGANFGGGLIALGLTRGGSVEARRIVTGNMVFRGGGSLAALFLLVTVAPPLDLLGASPAAQIVNAHLLFNASLLLIGLPLCLPMARVIEGVIGLAAEKEELPETRISALDRSALKVPHLAIAGATRELLGMGETVQRMLAPVMELYESGSAPLIARTRALDDELDRAQAEIKAYLTELARSRLEPADAQRCFELTGHAISLEHVGDIIVKDLLALAEKRRDRRLAFSEDGWRELTDLHQRVLSNLKLALNLLVSGDRETARQLVEEKDRLRQLERDSSARHLKRLREGSINAIETSEIHLETIRHYKQINSLIATIAYPILSQSGDLLESRLAVAEG